MKLQEKFKINTLQSKVDEPKERLYPPPPGRAQITKKDVGGFMT